MMSMRIDSLLDVVIEELRKEGHTFVIAVDDDRNDSIEYWYNITENSRANTTFSAVAAVFEERNDASDKSK